MPQSCDQCPFTTCVKIGQFPGSTNSVQKNSTPVGPIVGGVIAGVVAILLGVFVIWYCCARPRKRKDTWNPPEKRDQSTLARNDSRAHSIASTVLTRASNVIQIAYIPGVTGRSPPLSPEVPPPMPSLSNTTHGTPEPDTHFFMPGDLRSSTWSDTSFDQRISLAPSLARASLATTVYRDSAIVPPIPAQHAFRAQANVVSVKQAGFSNGPSPTPSRSSPLAQAPKPINIKNSSIVARHVVARPIELKKTGSGTLVPTAGNLARQSSNKTASTVTSEKTIVDFEEKEVVQSPVTDIADSPVFSPATPVLRDHSNLNSDAASASGVSAVSPLEAPSRSGITHRHTNSGGLTAMIEDAIKTASAASRNSPRPPISREDSGPFSDIHELPSSER